MLNRLLRRKKASRPLDHATVPEGRRIYAIGDVHGRNDLLLQLLGKIIKDDGERDKADSEIIFLGDLVDRGPDSAGVLDTAMQIREQLRNVRFLMGNHEEVYLAAATGDEKSVRFFNRIGGRETILSYDISLKEYIELDIVQLAERIPELFRQEHIEFIKGFEDHVIIGDYAFVHAGIRPGIPIAEQRKKDLRWIREDFLSAQEAHEKVIVYGHTITDDVVESGNRIGIDTGAYYSDKLTALCLQGSERWYLDTAS
ncbi:metallophosphoesterase family protein [Sphingorhabdus sp. YGSMI21]|uniref:metallophosphoesterase family protein n=1 Tax=Sphingorhabdus sp. YGSMI21 TaxID=2077182 RepID=UPI000C1F80C9|nr:metallophosphoesterase family protein [Sphingorhabdus sp. YGSMI21]ATW04576.1 serine/threonine protein phosphatase [Sphingorhabdus sp. YGSMI21]